MHVKHTSLQHPKVPRAIRNFSNSYKVSDPEQCTSVYYPWVQIRVPRVGPTGSLTLLHILTAWLDRLVTVLPFTSRCCPSSVSPGRPKNISHAPIKHVFAGLVSLWWENHSVSSRSSLLCQQRPTCDIKTSANRHILRQFWQVCHKQFATVLPKIYMPHVLTFCIWIYGTYILKCLIRAQTQLCWFIVGKNRFMALTCFPCVL